MMNRRFSTRERVLILVLIIVLTAVLYLIAILNPSVNSIAEAQSERLVLESELAGEQLKAERLAEMRSSLQELAESGDSMAITPNYDNIENVAPMLNTALTRASEFDLRFLPVTFSESFAIREISMVLVASSYNIAESIIEELSNGPYSCDISVLRIEPTDTASTNVATGEVAVSLTIVYYEAHRQAAE